MPMEEMFDPSAPFELEGVESDMEFYKFIARIRAQEREEVKNIPTIVHNVERSLDFDSTMEVEDLIRSPKFERSKISDGLLSRLK